MRWLWKLVYNIRIHRDEESIEDFIKEFKEQYNNETLKNQFRNVYFIIGTAYAGKTTMIKMLTEQYDGIMCEENWFFVKLVDSR